MSRDAEHKEKVERDVRDLRKDMDTRLLDLRGQIEEHHRRAVQRVAERREAVAGAVAEHPLLALGVAFAVGMAFGIALSKRD